MTACSTSVSVWPLLVMTVKVNATRARLVNPAAPGSTKYRTAVES